MHDQKKKTVNRIGKLVDNPSTLCQALGALLSVRFRRCSVSSCTWKHRLSRRVHSNTVLRDPYYTNFTPVAPLSIALACRGHFPQETAFGLGTPKGQDGSDSSDSIGNGPPPVLGAHEPGRPPPRCRSWHERRSKPPSYSLHHHTGSWESAWPPNLAFYVCHENLRGC